MNSLVFISDTHIGPNRYFEYDVIESAFKAALDEAAKTSSAALIHCGDLFDKRVVAPADLDCFSRIYDYARDAQVRIIAIEGNHGKDKSGSSVVRHYGTYVDPDVFVSYAEPTVVELDGVSLLLCPFGHDAVETALELAEEALSHPVLVGHCDVVGCDYGGGFSKSGLKATELIEIMQIADAVVLGHIHKPQHLGGSTQAAFVGAPFQYNFRACEQVRGFGRLDLNSFEVEFLPWSDGPRFVRVTSGEDLSTKDIDGAFVRAVLPLGEDVEEVTDRLLTMGANEKWLSVVQERIVLPVVRKTTMRPHDPVASIAEKYLDMKNIQGKDRMRLINVHHSLEEGT